MNIPDEEWIKEFEDGRKVKFIYQELTEDGHLLHLSPLSLKVMRSSIRSYLKKFVMTRWATGMHSRLRRQSWNFESRLAILLLIIVLLVWFRGGDAQRAYSRWGGRCGGPG